MKRQELSPGWADPLNEPRHSFDICARMVLFGRCSLFEPMGGGHAGSGTPA